MPIKYVDEKIVEKVIFDLSNLMVTLANVRQELIKKKNISPLLADKLINIELRITDNYCLLNGQLENQQIGASLK